MLPGRGVCAGHLDVPGVRHWGVLEQDVAAVAHGVPRVRAREVPVLPGAERLRCLPARQALHAGPQRLPRLQILCKAGDHSNSETGATTCSSCDGGRYSGDGTVVCAACPPGTRSLSRAASCTECERGKHASSEATSSCSVCVAGTHSNETGAVLCAECDAGKHQATTGKTDCVECKEGTYAAGAGSLSCSNCPRAYASTKGAASCALAATGYYLAPSSGDDLAQGLGVSAPCPAGAECRGGLQVPRPRRGYWVDRSSYAYADIILLSGAWCVARLLAERGLKRWRKPLSDEEAKAVAKVMGQDVRLAPPHRNDEETGSQRSLDQTDAMASTSDALLSQYLLKPQDISMAKRIGAGAFGEVFQGTCLGHPVAVKTMLQVTEENVKLFRQEIVLTATLRHPNVVNFVGACWGQELTCLVLEWVPKGSLNDLLSDTVQEKLRWDEPLLRLASDVARGMAYLHQREYYDEATRQRQRCTLRRDLKPANCLGTEFLVCKLTDFGTSRAKADAAEAVMSAVGTPLFGGPELTRGEAYDEKVDVYSFGMPLLGMAVEEPLLDFIGERWRVAFKKKKAPAQPLRVIRPMTEDEWRSVTSQRPVPCAPRAINALVVACCAADPSERPSFAEVLQELTEGACFSEIVENAGSGFGREPPTKQATLIFNGETSVQADHQYHHLRGDCGLRHRYPLEARFDCNGETSVQADHQYHRLRGDCGLRHRYPLEARKPANQQHHLVNTLVGAAGSRFLVSWIELWRRSEGTTGRSGR